MRRCRRITTAACSITSAASRRHPARPRSNPSLPNVARPSGSRSQSESRQRAGPPRSPYIQLRPDAGRSAHTPRVSSSSLVKEQDDRAWRSRFVDFTREDHAVGRRQLDALDLRGSHRAGQLENDTCQSNETHHVQPSVQHNLEHSGRGGMTTVGEDCRVDHLFRLKRAASLRHSGPG